MIKTIKKIAIGAFVGLVALQTMTALPVAAKTTVLGTLQFADSPFDLLSVKIFTNNSTPIYDYDYPTQNGSTYDCTYDFSRFAQTKSRIIGSQTWHIYTTMQDDPIRDAYRLNNVILKDNQGNVIKSYAYNGYLIRGGSEIISIQTNLRDYDLNYDEVVTLDDANLALKFALNQKIPSDLQIILGDTNSNGLFDLTDANYILKKAMNII